MSPVNPNALVPYVEGTRSKPRRSSRPAKKAAPSIGFLRSLGLVGLDHLESIVLAALATQAPVLLVGAHGTAKSMLVERIAGALGLVFRHYNASLLNYDDLIGIPLPEATGSGLRFVGTGGAIWGAGFAFFDEISRCRPELQNKLFPLIHERRVAGIDLPDLRHRWSAMNPPASADSAGGASDPIYLGSEALDAALADRFAFVVRMPGWRNLSEADRIALVSGTAAQSGGEGVALPALVARCAKIASRIERDERARIAAYVVRLIDLLGAGGIALSPRRARTMARCIASVHAAHLTLGTEVDLERSAELAVASALPQTAEEVPPSAATVAAAHHQAWEVAKLAADDPMREVLSERDSCRRVAAGYRLGLVDEQLSRVVTQSLAAEPCEARRIGIATAAFLALRGRRELTPAGWSVLASLARRVLEPRARRDWVTPGKNLELWREVERGLARTDEGKIRSALERSFVLAGFPDLWRETSWADALARFREDLTLFGLSPEDCA